MISRCLWFAPGVEVYGGCAIQNPPPANIRFDIGVPWHPIAPPIQRYRSQVMTAEFRLTDWSETGEVAHYELVSAPPKGWRWIAANGAIVAERL